MFETDGCVLCYNYSYFDVARPDLLSSKLIRPKSLCSGLAAVCMLRKTMSCSCPFGTGTNEINEVAVRLAEIKPPDTVTRVPKSMKTRLHWKGMCLI